MVRDALLAAILIVSKEMLAFLPNVELVTTLLMAYTVVYRFRALVPLYVFVAVEAVLYPGVYAVMYLYVWLVLWAIIMQLPRKPLPELVYMLIGALFGLVFGTLCAPVQAAYFGLSFKGMLAWIVSGFPYDLIHASGNFAIGILTPVLIRLLMKLEKQ